MVQKVFPKNMDVIKIKSLLREIPDFPIPVFLKCHHFYKFQGIIFQDIFPIFQDPVAVEMLITHFFAFLNSIVTTKIDVIVGN